MSKDTEAELAVCPSNVQPLCQELSPQFPFIWCQVEKILSQKPYGEVSFDCVWGKAGIKNYNNTSWNYKLTMDALFHSPATFQAPGVLQSFTVGLLVVNDPVLAKFRQQNKNWCKCNCQEAVLLTFSLVTIAICLFALFVPPWLLFVISLYYFIFTFWLHKKL